MKAMRLWHGVRMRQVAARPDPDGPSRVVTLPVSWDDGAADALTTLLPGDGPVSLAAAASVWLGMLAGRARQAGRNEAIALTLQALLHQRKVAPTAPVWRCEAGVPGFRLNVAAFHSAAAGFDVAGFGDAAGFVALACRYLSAASLRYEIGLTGLDDLLASAGLPYDSRAARDVGACLAALMRARVEQALEGEQRDLLAAGPAWPGPPRHCVFPGLAEAASKAHAAVLRAPDAVPATGVFAPGPADALLGVETGGIAPAFSPVRDLHLTRAAQDRLAASSMSPETALAAVLVGDTPLPLAGQAAHAAMQQAISPYLDMVPELPSELPAPAPHQVPLVAAACHRALPARHASTTRKVTVGGHRVFLRTAEYDDGKLGEISLTMPRESASVRALSDCVAQAVSLGLQHGVPLEEFVDAFTHTRFAPAGAVEGDTDVDRATSVLDYVFRTLSATYLNRVLPAAEMDEWPGEAPADAPLLPLDLPAGGARRRGFRLVA